VNRRQLVLGATAAGLVPGSVDSAPATPPSAWSRTKKFRDIRGVRMAYHEAGQGDPIVFLHGNPTSSYLWRKVIPALTPWGRCIAPDLVGMGDSGKLPDSSDKAYAYTAHRDYLYRLLDELGVTDKVTLVLHDWGSALGFDWAQHNPERVVAIAYMEAIIKAPGGPAPGESEGGAYFDAIRSEKGEALILDQNMFVEQMLLDPLKYYLTAEDQAEYRRPFASPGESRRPTLTWPRELPINGVPADNDRLVRSYTGWLLESPVPKLFVRAVPGSIFRDESLLKLARSFRNQKEVTVYGGHFVQEVSGVAIGRALAAWLPTVRA
jgi:haloalkane dehalogenase